MTEGADSSGLCAVMARAERDWDNQALHDMLLELCSEPAQLAQLATWYRSHSRDARRAAVAHTQLDRLTVKAMLHLDSQRSNRRPVERDNRGKYLLIAFFLVGSAILATYL